MLRMHLDVDDLVRVRVGATWGPWAETVLCLDALRDRRPTSRFRLWSAAAKRVADRQQVELAGFLRPMPGMVADLLTLVGTVDTFDRGAQRLAARPAADVRAELRDFTGEGLPSWLTGLDQARPKARLALTQVLSKTHQHLVAPYWPSMLSHLTGERARLGRQIADHGVEQLLEWLHPNIRWRPPVLEVVGGAPWHPGPLDVQLRGRGIVIVPSVFCGRVPIPLFPLDGGSMLLLVPAPPELADAPAVWKARSADGDPLATLLGRTRAAVLRALDDGSTTTELARRLEISPSGASQHTTALRSAGLITRRRDRNRMVHTTTDLGARLLDNAS
jgi:DNA-binding transcriptional ArsR family regulator